jgi:hypothetical protein
MVIKRRLFQLFVLALLSATYNVRVDCKIIEIGRS